MPIKGTTISLRLTLDWNLYQVLQNEALVRHCSLAVIVKDAVALWAEHRTRSEVVDIGRSEATQYSDILSEIIRVFTEVEIEEQCRNGSIK